MEMEGEEMENAKIDNTLNLALSVPEGERLLTEDLNIGYDPADNVWELIIKYTGSLNRIREELNIRITPLSAGYAVILIEEALIGRLSDYEEIIFIEKPRSLYFEDETGNAASCVQAVRTAYGLSGEGTLIAVLDSGIDYAHPDFRKEDGTTRILSLWDQTIREGRPPDGFTEGTEYTAEEINQALEQTDRVRQLAIVPSTDLSGHGTHVAGICAGGGRGRGGEGMGVAPESGLIIVKLGNSVGNSFPRTTQLMTALEYAVRKSAEYNRPIAVNISFGNNYGSHNGFSLLENYINEMAVLYRSCIVIGTGNEGSAGRHASGALENGREEIVELAVGEGQVNLNLQIWKNYYDDFSISLISPSGFRVGPIPAVLGNQQFRIGNTEILLYYGEPIPFNSAQEIYFEFLPALHGQYSQSGSLSAGDPAQGVIDTGIWQIILTPEKIVTGEYRMWLPAGGVASFQTRFVEPSEELTLTVPSTALRAISVGAYNANTESPAYFSGRGITDGGFTKPDLVAPGVDIISAAPGGGYTARSGTSMAAPFVTGAAALLMQWGIIQNRDPYLYGEKVKAYLIKGARPLPGYPDVPNPVTGYGALCVADSIPR